ncbi:E3 ubiquitin-protein ligase RBBP6-like [Leptinotarsa decemlineata]|uniref:E3 ubiquitin-protein ligase RBBP6-like n=1 Tax=Leptinotarsa decemlineata TaxID=7539 RepID=UPI003D30B6C3
MSVYYKFRSAVKYYRVTFDGQHISVKDLRNAIMLQKRIGKNNDVDLEIMDAQTKSVYTDVNYLIPRNSSLLIARIPVTPRKTKQWESHGEGCAALPKVAEEGPIEKSANLSSLNISEEDKIRLMMLQSTQNYDPSKYKKFRGFNQVGRLPPNYRCHKCHQEGHWIKDCTFADGKGVKKSTGIPRSFMVNVEGPQVPGARMIHDGEYAVPLVDYEAYNQKVVPASVNGPKLDSPDNLVENNKLYFENLENNVGNHSENIYLHPVEGLMSSPPEVADVIVTTERDESKEFPFSFSSTKLDPIESSCSGMSARTLLNESTAKCDSAIPLRCDFSDRMSETASLDGPKAEYGNIPSILGQVIACASQPLPMATIQNPPPNYGFPFSWYTPGIAPEHSGMALRCDISSHPPIESY